MSGLFEDSGQNIVWLTDRVIIIDRDTDTLIGIKRDLTALATNTSNVVTGTWTVKYTGPSMGHSNSYLLIATTDSYICCTYFYTILQYPNKTGVIYIFKKSDNYSIRYTLPVSLPSGVSRIYLLDNIHCSNNQVVIRAVDSIGQYPPYIFMYDGTTIHDMGPIGNYANHAVVSLNTPIYNVDNICVSYTDNEYFISTDCINWDIHTII